MTDVTVTDLSHDVVVTDTTTTVTISENGPAGPTGPQGPKGDTGDTGAGFAPDPGTGVGLEPDYFDAGGHGGIIIFTGGWTTMPATMPGGRVHVQVAVDAGFTIVVADYGLAVGGGDYPELGFRMSFAVDMAATPALYLRVRSVDVYGNTSDWVNLDGATPLGGGAATPVTTTPPLGAERLQEVTKEVAVYPLRLGTNHLLVTEDSTLTVPSGRSTEYAYHVTAVIEQDGTGGWVVNWPAEILWPGGSPPALSTAAGSVAVIQLVSIDGAHDYLAHTIADQVQ